MPPAFKGPLVTRVLLHESVWDGIATNVSRREERLAVTPLLAVSEPQWAGLIISLSDHIGLALGLAASVLGIIRELEPDARLVFVQRLRNQHGDLVRHLVAWITITALVFDGDCRKPGFTMILDEAMASVETVGVLKPPLHGSILVLHLLVDLDFPPAVAGDRWMRWLWRCGRVLGRSEGHSPPTEARTLVPSTNGVAVEFVDTVLAAHMDFGDRLLSTLRSTAFSDLPGLVSSAATDLPLNMALLLAAKLLLGAGKENL